MNWETHRVFNQPKPLSNSNLFLSDTALREAVTRQHAAWDFDVLASLGQQLGSAESLELGRLANANPPDLLRFEPTGEPLDDVRFHPAWHLLMQGLVANRVHNLSWEEHARIGSTVARAARFMLHAQVEAGTLCPITMTHGAIPLLQQHLPAEFKGWLTPLMSDRYDAHLLTGDKKRGLLIGMGMTEKQGGSDVLSNTTTAKPLDARGPGKAYRLIGHKWFFSVPQSDAHLVLAQTEGGLSCFFLPRILPDGERNHVRIQRLKDKLGNRSNASSEVEFFDAVGWLLGEEGEGVRHILKMGGHTRFDCALGSHAMMRRAFSVALYHAFQRQAFGKPLIEQPLMRQVLSKMALRLEGQTALLFRLASARSRENEAAEQVFSRLLTPAAKFEVCRQGIPFVAEAMEVLGGLGYCEESELPRLYREMPVNSIWEGSGNVMCLDVLRSLKKLPSAGEHLLQRLHQVRGQNRLFDKAVRQFSQRLKRSDEAQARNLASQLFNLFAAAEMLEFSSPPLADAWCRLTLDDRGDSLIDERLCQQLLERAIGAQ